MSDGVHPLVIAWTLQALAILSPGPGVALVFAVATGAGRAAAVATALGTLYLLWLAYGAIRRARATTGLSAARGSAASIWTNMSAGYLLQVSNPKVILFWLSAAGLGGIGNGSWTNAVAFVIGAFVVTFVGYSAWAFFLSTAALRRGYMRAQRWVETALSGFFILAAYKLATSGS